MIDPERIDAHKTRRHFTAFLVGLIACLSILAIQIWRYWFICDDAFISFRYARNLATGHGLVFNPGFERVEGYTNFLWVLMLAGARVLGILPEHACHVLSIGAGVGIVLLVTGYCVKELPKVRSCLWALWPALMLSFNRTFAMWCTSGLETRLFGILVIAGVICAIREAQDPRETRGLPWCSFIFGLAALTRPEGILIGSCAMAASHLVMAARGRFNGRLVAMDAAVFVAIVGGHFVFRRVYYGDWLPNTYYAKVGGRTWWDIGGAYLSAFALEYALILWLPMILLGLWAARSRLSAGVWVPMAVLIPYVTYIAAVGGDHFEYRPLDILFPLLGLVAIQSLRAVRKAGRSLILASWLVITLFAGNIIPEMIRQDFPPGYRPGFPGVSPRDSSAHELIDSKERASLWSVPALGAYLQKINALAAETSRHFVCIRQEELRRFCSITIQEGRWLAAAISNGSLPRDLHLATGCVGAISYYADIRTLDVLGLTDRVVARSPSAGERTMAHEKMASPEYIRSMGVDLRANDDVLIIFPDRHPKIMGYAQESNLGIGATVFAKLSDGLYLAAMPVQGTDAIKRRAKSVHFLTAGQVLSEQLKAAEGDQTSNRQDEFGIAYDITLVDQCEELAEYNAYAEVKINLERALAINPLNRAALMAISHYGFTPKPPQKTTRSPIR